MIPIKFNGFNCIFAKNQKPYQPLPAHKEMGRDGTVTTCWELSLWEKIIMFINGRVYLQQLTFNDLLQPQRLSVRRPFLKQVNIVQEEEEDEENENRSKSNK